jgi:glycerophosphoryl diester phosphodiesterase
MIKIIFIVLVIYIFCIAPNKSRKNVMSDFEKYYYAHRGLFDNSTKFCENSIPAFKRAVKNNFGIELDVQLTKDDKLVVFHDKTLLRMCNVNKKLTDCSYKELKKYKLVGSNEHIPLLCDVLNVINGKVPIIVEIKPDGNYLKTTKLTALMMDNYNGRYCVESFHPLALRWYKKNRPNIIRGQLSTNFFKEHTKGKWYEKFFLTNLMFNFISKPDFIAYNHLFSNQITFRLCKNLFHAECVAWTIKNEEQLDKAKNVFDIIIFDSFMPK